MIDIVNILQYHECGHLGGCSGEQPERLIDATPGADILTHLDRLGVDAERILPPVLGSYNVLTNFLTEFACQLAALVILAARDKDRQGASFSASSRLSSRFSQPMPRASAVPYLSTH